MKNRHTGRVLGRKRNQRRALIRTLLGSLVLHERITTTEAKAKEVKNFIDQIVNKAKVAQSDKDRRLSMIRELHKEIPAVAVKKLLTDFVTRFEGRNSGYVRVVKLDARKSDSARMAIIEFVKVMAEKKQKIDRQYHLIDAQGKILGRLATEVATILMGKRKVDFAPHIDGGDFVVIINTDSIDVTGNKREAKVYHRFSGYPGGITSITLKDQLKKDSRKVIRQAVHSMLPKNKLRDRMLTRLRLHKGAEHDHKTIHVIHE